MTDFPKAVEYSSAVINSMSINSVGYEVVSHTTNFGSGTAWPSANLAIFIPFRIAAPYLVQKMVWFNNSSVGTDSVDAGIYDAQGNQIVHTGSTLTAGASVIQSASVTPTILQSGFYFMAMAVNGTTNTLQRTGPVAPMAAAMGTYQMATAFPLPSTATFTQNAQAYLPLLGMTTQAIF